MNPNPRVALFTDTFFEPNGVATLSRQFAHFAESHSVPLLAVRGAAETSFTSRGSVQTQQLKRSLAAFPLDKDLYFDPLLMRYKQALVSRLTEFRPDLVHITGPGDLGFLGLSVSHALGVPLVASWHTNLHEYLAKRLDLSLRFLPSNLRHRITGFAESQSLRGFLRFYKTARFSLAPNQTSVDLIHAGTHRPAFLMGHGVDLSDFQPVPRPRGESQPFCIGYVGRLTTEKNVRRFVEIEKQLLAAGETKFKFLIVGDGGQQSYLQANLRHAEFTGVLHGQQLAAAYNQMDAFVFPSLTDTFGLVVLEAMATAVPIILTPDTGRRVGVEDGVSGFLSEDFTGSLRLLMHNATLRESMGRAARKFAVANSWERVFEQLYETYSEGIALSNRLRAEKAALVQVS